MGDSVTFFGPRQDTERFYQAADVFILPTEYETFSLAAYEAAASGLPVVATRVNGVEDLITDGETGLFFTRSPGGLASALQTLAGDSKLRARMGLAGRRRASAFTWDRSVDAVVRAYEELLGTRSVVAR